MENQQLTHTLGGSLDELRNERDEWHLAMGYAQSLVDGTDYLNWLPVSCPTCS